MNMDCIFKSLLILTFFIVYSNCRTLDEFQFQCYGERTLCSFPTEYCSSEIRKCVECTPAVCSNKENIPLGCSHACRGEEEGEGEETCSWKIPFIVVIIVFIFLILAIVVLAKLKVVSFRCCDQRNRNNVTAGYSSVSSITDNSSSPSPALKPKEVVQASSAHGDDTTCYGDKKLKNVPPSQDPIDDYIPTTHHCRV